MKTLEILFFKSKSSASCIAVERILKALAEKINGYFSKCIVNIIVCDMEVESSYRKALELGIESSPILLIGDDKFDEKVTDKELFEVVASRLDLDCSEKEKLWQHVSDFYFPKGVKELGIKPIGFVRIAENDQTVKDRFEGVEGSIEVLDEYTEGLEEIEGFSHIIVVAFLDRVKEEERKTLKVKPKWLVGFGKGQDVIKPVGVFSTRSPHRPNPLGITVVQLLWREGGMLKVKGLDLFNGTPVVDIKPYVPETVDEVRFPSWHEEMVKNVKKKFGRDLF